VVITGPVNAQVTETPTTGSAASSQATVTIPYRQLGFYYGLLGGKAVTGQTLTGTSGANSALAFRQSDAITWGTTIGLNAWTNNTPLTGSQYATVTGLAFTLMNGSTVVYDNNGIEGGTATTTGNFYNNLGGGSDTLKPGLEDLYSMSNYFPLAFAGAFTLTQSTTITTLIGYFDPGASNTLPFDPTNPYLKYRMNIFSSVAGPLPKETGSFTGDIFSSDTAAGTFSFSATNVKMVSSVTTNNPKTIYRLSYQLTTPLTLPAGQYWFGHDASIRATPAASSTSSFTESPISVTDSTGAGVDSPRTITEEELTSIVRKQVGRPIRPPQHINLFGTDVILEDSWNLPEPVVVRPSSPVRPLPE
jgi:hypothetical protein